MHTDLDNRTIEEKIEEAYKNKDIEELRDLALTENHLHEDMNSYHTNSMKRLAEILEMDMEEFNEEPRFKWVTSELSSVMRELKTLRAYKERSTTKLNNPIQN